MIFISDVHHQLEYLKLLPKKNEPVVVLGDLINWIDYRNGEGIAKEVFGLENVKKLIEVVTDVRSIALPILSTLSLKNSNLLLCNLWLDV